MALRGVLRTIAGDRLGFWCPGCEQMHAVTVAPHPHPWGFNGDFDKPTFTPSVHVTSGHYMLGHCGDCWCTYNAKHPDKPASFKCRSCHSFVTDGRIQFLDDCTHALAGQTVALTAPTL
jgi:hypothetical protein